MFQQRLEQKSFYHNTYSCWRYMDSHQWKNGQVCAPEHLIPPTDANVVAYQNWFELHILGKQFQEWISDAFGRASAELCREDGIVQELGQPITTFTHVMDYILSCENVSAFCRGDYVKVMRAIA